MTWMPRTTSTWPCVATTTAHRSIGHMPRASPWPDLAAQALLGKDVPPFVTVEAQSMTRDNLAETWSTNVGVEVSDEIAAALEEDC